MGNSTEELHKILSDTSVLRKVGDILYHIFIFKISQLQVYDNDIKIIQNIFMSITRHQRCTCP